VLALGEGEGGYFFGKKGCSSALTEGIRGGTQGAFQSLRGRNPRKKIELCSFTLGNRKRGGGRLVVAWEGGGGNDVLWQKKKGKLLVL